MSVRPALRMARRDVRRSLGRSLLVVAMVALPVAGAAFVDVVLRTADVRGAEKVPLELGRTADARVVPQSAGNLVLQRPDATYGEQPSITTAPGEPQPEPPAQLPPTDPRPLLPEGTRVIPDRQGEVGVRTTDGLTVARFRELDIADPLAQGLFTVVDGRAPAAAGEVAVTTRLLEVLGQEVGDQLQVPTPRTTLRIVGTVRPVSDAQGATVAVALPGTLLDEVPPGAGYTEPASLLVDTPEPVSWQQVLDLNAVGVAVFSRAVVEDPPPRSAIPLYDDPSRSQDGGPALEEVLAITLVVGLAMAEVALLAGAAFAVGMRRESRALGLLAAAGAGRRQVRAVVLWQGLVLGLLGGVVGVVVGTLGGVAGVLVATQRFDQFLLAPDVRPLELAALTLVGVVTGVAAAVLPARTAARQDVVAALSGRRGVVRTRRRYPVIGLVTAAVGAALALGGGALALGLEQDEDGSPLLAVVALLALVGAVLTQVGLIVATPAIVGAASRLGRFLPLAPRLALRDAARHRGRTAPAVAAVLGAVAGSVALTLFVASMSDKDEREYMPTLATGQALLRSSYGPAEVSVEGQLAAVRRIAPPDEVFRVQSFPYDPTCTTACRTVAVVPPPELRCPLDVRSSRGEQPSAQELAAAEQDERCNRGTWTNTPFSGPVVGGYDEYVRLVREPSAAARAALEAGGMVVFDASHVGDGRGVVEVATYDATSGRMAGVRSVRVPAVHVPLDGRGYVTGWLSPQAAAAVGVPVGLDATVVQYDVPPDDDTEEAISAALADQGQQSLFRVERGYRDAYGIGLLALLLASAVVTLGAAGVATGLAQADGRADQSTLAAVGADPRLRRRLTAFQAAVVAGLGALLGTASGFVPMAAFIYADTELRFVPPWTNLLVIAVGVPAVAAVAAGLVTRSRLPLSRRLAA